MAKINLRNGAHEIGRWRNERGSERLLRSDGVMMFKVRGGTFGASEKTSWRTAKDADEWMALAGYRRV